MTSYQKRMSRFVWASNTYSLGVPIALYFLSAGLVAWVIWASTATLLYAAAIGFDAVYDSLKEQVWALRSGQQASDV